MGYGVGMRSSVGSTQGGFGMSTVSRFGSNSAPALITDASDTNGDSDYIHQFDANGTLVLTSKKHRVLGKGASSDLSVKGGKLFTRTSTVFDHVFSPSSPTAASPLVRYGSMNNKPLAIICKFPILKDPTNMLNALQKACVVCKRIQTLASLHGLPFVQTLLEQGLPRSLVVFLSRSYIYQCHFMEIQLPSQSLYTMTVLCMPQVDEASIHNALIFLLNQMGAIEICVSIIKYYIDNVNIVSHALGSLYALMPTNDAHAMMLTSTHTNHYAQVFSDDSSSLMLLALCVEQYVEQSSAVVLYVCGVFSKLIRARCVEDKLRGARCLYVFRRLHDVLKAHSETAGCHLPKRELLCLYNTIEDLYFSAKYAHLPLPAPIPYSELPDRTLQQDVIIQIDEHTLLPFLISQLTLYAENPPLVTPALRSIGNMCFERHDVQRRLGDIETHFPREMLRILKHYHKYVRLGSRDERVQGVRVLPEALLTLANSIYNIGKCDGGPLPKPASPTKTPRSNNGTVSSWDKLMRHYLAEGLGEVVCELFDHAHLSNPLLHSLLILLTKMMQRGNSLCTQRLVALGLCDKVRIVYCYGVCPTV
ncbi:hypothetical protein EON65_38980 [archaeon]|nr:MAG: hypothetical protein EON65_38980 [archaeon]